MEKHAKKLMKSAKSNFSKAKRSYTCRSLKDLVRAYRACTTSAEERALVKKESAHIRDLFREGDKAFRRQNIAKLLFFHMNGYPTSFGMTECIKLCASPKYSDKRVAYLGLTILVDETAEILMLMTNCLKQDLLSSDRSIATLALTVLADIASADMVRDLLPEIELHLVSQDPHLRKKALAAAVRAARKLDEDELSGLLEILPRALDAASPAALVAASALVIETARKHPQTLPVLREACFHPFAAALRTLLLSGARAADTTVSGVRNPFLTVKLLHALRVVTAHGAPPPLVEALSELVSQLASNTSPNHVVGCAVLYECVRLATAIPADAHLRMVAVEILGNFLAHKLATIRFVALQELVKVCTFAEEGKHVAQYRETILSCLAESDPTISQMAVELVYGIANRDNVEEMIAQLLKYLDGDHPPHHLEETCYKIFDMTDRIGSSMNFKVITFVSALEKVDLAMPENLITAFAAMISEDKNAQMQATATLFRAALMPSPSDNAGSAGLAVMDAGQQPNEAKRDAEVSSKKRRKPRLERLALYVVGEYGDMVMNQSAELETHKVIDAIERLLKASPIAEPSWIENSSAEYLAEICRVRETALGALAKLATRVDSSSGSNEAGGTGLGALGLGGDKPLAIMPSAPAPKQELSGLGGDLLAGLGISNSKALVPVQAGNENGSILGGDDSGLGEVLLRIRSIIAVYRKSRDLETQQRACEYSNLLTSEMAHIRSGALSRMPPIDFNQIKERAARRRAQSQAVVSHPNAASNDLLSLIDGASEPSTATPALPAGSELLAITYGNTAGAASSSKSNNQDLDDLLGLPSAAPSNIAANTGVSAGLGLDELLGGAGSVNRAATAKSTQGSQSNELSGLELLSSQFGSFDVGSKKSGPVEIGSVGFAPTPGTSAEAEFFRDDPSDLTGLRVVVTFTNVSQERISDFVFQLAVPNGMSVQMQPPTGSAIEIGGKLSQMSVVSNPDHGKRKMRFMYRVQYMGGGSAEVTQVQGLLKSLPVGL